MFSKKIIVVDLDGTLVKFDSSLHIAKKIAKKNFILGVRILWVYFSKGEAKAKHFVANLVKDFEYVINHELVEYLKDQVGVCDIILATGSNEKIANKINEDLGKLFSKVIASDEKINCIGQNKLKALRDVIGDEQFVYIGDSWQDYVLWQASSEIGLVVKSEKQAIIKVVEKLGKPVKIFYFI